MTRRPYVGQMKAAIARIDPALPVIDLAHDAPVFRPRECAYLLAALIAPLPAAAVIVGVVDPGVGAERAALIVEAGGRHFVGPDNGLFEIVMRRARQPRAWRITWRPERLSASFHGRDLFAPVAARLARGEDVPAEEVAAATLRRPDFPDDLAAVVYVDHYGNAMTGMRADGLGADAVLGVRGHYLPRARTFSDVPPGAPLWYENAHGLAEIAVNQGRADVVLGLAPGVPVALYPGGVPA